MTDFILGAYKITVDGPFPSPVDHIVSDLSTMTRPSWVAPQAWLGYIELDKAMVLV